MTLGEKIVRLREEKRLSAGQLAKAARLSRGYLWQLESGGKNNPSLEVLQKLAGVLGVTVAELGENAFPEHKEADLPPGLQAFLKTRAHALGVLKPDVEIMKRISFRGKQPDNPEDWELLFLFLKKWAH